MKKAMAIFVVALLASALNGSLLVTFSLANPYEPHTPDHYVNLYLPHNATYSNAVPIKFEVESDWGGGLVDSVDLIKVYLDGDSCENMKRLSFSLAGTNVFTASLAGLEPGGHSIYVVVYVTLRSSIGGIYTAVYDSSDVSNVVCFTVGLPSPPVVAISSPEQFGTYNSSSVPLSFTVDKPVSWMGYSLDGQDNVTAVGNTTLTGLPEGEHVVVVYATDVFGQTRCSHTRYFTVAESSASFPTPFPLMWFAVAVVASAAAVSFGLVAYVLRRKSKRGNQT